LGAGVGLDAGASAGAGAGAGVGAGVALVRARVWRGCGSAVASGRGFGSWARRSGLDSSFPRSIRREST
jgi:hypothetical protein